MIRTVLGAWASMVNIVTEYLSWFKSNTGHQLKVLFFYVVKYIVDILNYHIDNEKHHRKLTHIICSDLKTNTTPLSHEKVISNQELNSLDGCQNSGKIIQTGNGTSFEFEQEVSDTSSNDMDEIILVKDDGILPGADGFPLNNNPRRRHPFGRPRMRG